MLTWKSQAIAVEGLEAGVAGLCPASREDRPRWYLATCDGWLKLVDLDDGATMLSVRLPFSFESPGSATLSASRDGRFVAVVPRRGLFGALYDTREQRLSPLERTDYHANVSGWAVGIVPRGDGEILFLATAWNQLDAFELPSMKKLTPAPGEPGLDYFLGTLAASPSGRRLASFGWYWHPVGAVKIIEVEPWLATPAVQPAAVANQDPALADWWDDEVCWLDERRIAMIGDEEREDHPMFDDRTGLAVLDAGTGAVAHFVPGVTGAGFGSDGERLYVLGSTTRVLASDSLEVLSTLEHETDAWHPAARVLLSCPQLNGKDGPCVLHWLAGTLGARPTRLPAETGPLTRETMNVFADALEEAGLEAALVSHCREHRSHGRRCWVLEGLG